MYKTPDHFATEHGKVTVWNHSFTTATDHDARGLFYLLYFVPNIFTLCFLLKAMDPRPLASLGTHKKPKIVNNSSVKEELVTLY